MLSDWAFRFREYHISDLIAGRPIDTLFARRFQGLQFSISKPGDLSGNAVHFWHIGFQLARRTKSFALLSQLRWSLE